jgi:nitrogen fixation NifU-like protein
MRMDGYSAKILEHAKYPRKFGRISDPDRRFEEVNPLCGDRIRVELRVTGMGAVEDIRVSGEMCAMAKAAASLLLAAFEGRTPAASIDGRDEQVLKALGGPIKRHRVRCALLPVLALRGAILSGNTHATSS